jgi:hypothetical protein
MAGESETTPRKSNNNHTRVPTVSRICHDQTMIELVYDPKARKTGLVVSRFDGLWNIEQEVRVETGETLVPYSASNNLILNECVLLPSKPEDFGSKAELIESIRDFIRNYVDISELFEQIAAYYVLLSWVHDAFNDLPYLRFRGDYGTGKTRSLMAIGSLCYKPFFASAASTVSPIFHTLDAFRGTLIMDEADLPFSDARADIVKIFNNGTVRGMPVLRMVQNKNKEFNPRSFNVFGPKVVAMRSSFDDPALESRFLTEETGRHPLRADIPIQLPTELRIRALELRNRLLSFRLRHFHQLNVGSAATLPPVDPRLRQMIASLLCLVDDPSLRNAIQAELVEMNADIAIDRQETTEAAVLKTAVEVFASAKPGNVPLRDIAARFNAAYSGELGHPVSNRWIGSVLRKRLHIRTHKCNGNYVIAPAVKPDIDALAARLGITPGV